MSLRHMTGSAVCADKECEGFSELLDDQNSFVKTIIKPNTQTHTELRIKAKAWVKIVHNLQTDGQTRQTCRQKHRQTDRRAWCDDRRQKTSAASSSGCSLMAICSRCGGKQNLLQLATRSTMLAEGERRKKEHRPFVFLLLSLPSSCKEGSRRCTVQKSLLTFSFFYPCSESLGDQICHTGSKRSQFYRAAVWRQRAAEQSYTLSVFQEIQQEASSKQINASSFSSAGSCRYRIRGSIQQPKKEK